MLSAQQKCYSVLYFFICVCVCVYVCVHMCKCVVLVPMKLATGVGISSGCELSTWMLESKLDPLEEQQELFTIEPSL